MKIICFHLLNDRSGSPAVLSMAIKGLLKKGYSIKLYTSGKGVLSDINHENFKINYGFYRFKKNKLITTLLYILIQLYWIIVCFKYIFTKKSVFYINTILPVGPALAAFAFRKKIIYHFHEAPDVKGFTYRFLAKVMKAISHKIICVSKYQFDTLDTIKGIVIYNAIPDEFISQGINSYPQYTSTPNILMISSLKKYKGIFEFVKLSLNFKNYHFHLVLNASKKEVDLFIKELTFSDNISFYPRQSDLYMFYKKSHLLLNLSIPELFIETFGLTVSEAMAFGVPSIVPPVGGISELITDGYNGYKVHPLDKESLHLKLVSLFDSKQVYSNFVHNSKKEVMKYSEAVFISKIDLLLSTI